jgi:starvation-inducible DNA-binding protein
MKTNVLDHPVTVNQLNQTLSDLQVVYQNLRTMHWLVKGPDFYQLHKMYEELYNETAETIDEVAERILMVGGVPLHTYSDYLANSRVAVLAQVPEGKESLRIVVSLYEHVLKNYREIVKTAADNSDEGTVALMGELIGSTEKKLWMLKSTLA